MQMDFHYYATYCAAYLAGFSHEESLDICYSAQFVDCCSAALLTRIRAPRTAATTQQQLELMDGRTDLLGRQNITRIWASFHFLPYDLYADVPGRPAMYRSKYRLLCNVNGTLVRDTVQLAQQVGTLQAAGIAMHVLADTWAHRYFAGTPSLVINNVNYYIYEILHGEEADGSERQITFRHSKSAPDDPEKGLYSATIYQSSEHSIMNLGHGRAGHLPDYSYARYRYLPAWGDYEEIVKDNPDDYWHAFLQMIYALQYLHGTLPVFETGRYAEAEAEPFREQVMQILEKRQTDACADWKAFAETLSGHTVPDFDIEKYQAEYLDPAVYDKSGTFLGRFIRAAQEQKKMVTEKIFRSGSMLAGFPLSISEMRGKGSLQKYFRVVRTYGRDGK